MFARFFGHGNSINNLLIPLCLAGVVRLNKLMFTLEIWIVGDSVIMLFKIGERNYFFKCSNHSLFLMNSISIYSLIFGLLMLYIVLILFNCHIWLIDFNSMPTALELLYVKILRNRVHCIFPVSYLILRSLSFCTWSYRKRIFFKPKNLPHRWNIHIYYYSWWAWTRVLWQ